MGKRKKPIPTVGYAHRMHNKAKKNWTSERKMKQGKHGAYGLYAEKKREGKTPPLDTGL